MKEKILAHDMKLGFRCKVYDVGPRLERKVSFFTDNGYLEAGSEEAEGFAKEAARLLFLSLLSESQQSLLSELHDLLDNEFSIVRGYDDEEGGDVDVH